MYIQQSYIINSKGFIITTSAENKKTKTQTKLHLISFIVKVCAYILRTYSHGYLYIYVLCFKHGLVKTNNIERLKTLHQL